VRPALPAGHRLERLSKNHPRKQFQCGRPAVDEWLHARALQHQTKHLSTTKALLDENGAIVGYYTLATEIVDFGLLPAAETKKLPKRTLPVAALAWLGVSANRQGEGLGRLLLSLALCDCAEAGRTFAFVAVVFDCIDDAAKAFYRRYDFEELPGRPYRLFLFAAKLKLIVGE
jgi:GNAT superfamily N-acetyltransferase